MGHPALRTPGSGRPAGKARIARCREALSGMISISARSVSRNRLFSFSAAVYGCTVGRAFTPAASPILQRKRCFAFFEYAEVRRAKSPALQCKANACGRDKSRPYEYFLGCSAIYCAAGRSAGRFRNRLASLRLFLHRCARFRGIAARESPAKAWLMAVLTAPLGAARADFGTGSLRSACFCIALRAISRHSRSLGFLVG